MNDIFSRQANQLNGVFTADNSLITFNQPSGSASNLGVLTQQLAFNYNQSLARFYELGSTNIYYVGGRTQGQMSMNRIIGPAGSMQYFISQYGNICNAAINGLSITLAQTDCSGVSGTTVPSTYTLSYVVLVGVRLGVTAQDFIITESTDGVFGSLELN